MNDQSQGFLELKPFPGNQGITVCFAGKNWVSSTIKTFKDGKGKNKDLISVSKTRLVPVSVVSALKLPKDIFLAEQKEVKPKK